MVHSTPGACMVAAWTFLAFLALAVLVPQGSADESCCPGDPYICDLIDTCAPVEWCDDFYGDCSPFFHHYTQKKPRILRYCWTPIDEEECIECGLEYNDGCCIWLGGSGECDCMGGCPDP